MCIRDSLKRHLADVRRSGREAVGHLAADHALDDALLADVVLLLKGLYGMAVADDGALVGAVADLVELVGDDDAGDALLFKGEEQVQKLFCVAFGERGGRLVEDEELDVLGPVSYTHLMKTGCSL